MKKLNLLAIRLDGGTQARLELNQDTVAEYAERMRDGEEFPLITVFYDGTDHWLADGFHRYFAIKSNFTRRAITLDQASIEVEISEGTLQDAILHSYGANSKRGLAMTSADNRSVISNMLLHETFGKWSNAEISRHVGVSSMTVGRVKQSMAMPEDDSKKTFTTKAGDKRTIDTKNIGRKKVDEPAPVVDESDTKLDELTETINDLSEENKILKDKIAVGQWDASEIEKIDIHEVIADLREQVRVLEIDNKALRESRDMFQMRNVELMRKVKSIQAKTK